MAATPLLYGNEIRSCGLKNAEQFEGYANAAPILRGSCMVREHSNFYASG